MTLTLKNAPLVEVVIGIDFEDIDWFQTTHFGLYWGSIGDRYPISEDQPPIGSLKIDLHEIGLPPLRRTWFISEDQSTLIQLQSNKFLLNWRRTTDVEYPRFSILKKKFFQELMGFKEFLSGFSEQEFDFVIKGCELSYINIIDDHEDWGNLENVTKLLPHIDWRNANAEFLGVPRQFSWSSEFEISDEMVLRTLAKSVARKTSEGKKRAIQLDLNVTGLNVERTEDGLSSWFDEAHDTVINGFKDLTPKEAREEWWEISYE